MQPAIGDKELAQSKQVLPSKEVESSDPAKQIIASSVYMISLIVWPN